MKKLFFFLPVFLCFGFLTHASGKQNIPFLIYHSIDEFNGHGSKKLYVTPDNFEKQMTYLKKNGFTLLTFERWQDRKKVNKPIFITLDDGYRNNLNVYAIFQKLKDNQFKPTATIFAISDFVGRPRRLSNMELKQLSDSGFFSIQSHTATHPYLTKTKNLETELKSSKQKLEQITGKPVIALAYPYGHFDGRVVANTKKYYSFGLTTTPGLFSEQGVENEYDLLPRRYVYYSTTLAEFAKLVN